MLSQLDDRYFVGLRNRYTFKLFFRVQKADGSGKVIGQHFQEECMVRSAVTELDLEPGKYHVLFKVDVQKHDDNKSLLDTVKEYSVGNRRKFMQIGLSHDLAYAKGFAEAERKRKMYAARDERKKKRAEEIKALNEGIAKIKAKEKENQEKAEKEAAEKKAKLEKMKDTGVGPDDELEKKEGEDSEEKKEEDKSDEKSDGKSEDKPEEKSEEKAEEKSEEKAEEKAEEKSEDTKEEPKEAVKAEEKEKAKEEEIQPVKKSVTFNEKTRPQISHAHRSQSFPAPRREVEISEGEDTEEESDGEEVDEEAEEGDGAEDGQTITMVDSRGHVYLVATGDGPGGDAGVQTDTSAPEPEDEPGRPYAPPFLKPMLTICRLGR